jgi:hypothetical protein
VILRVVSGRVPPGQLDSVIAAYRRGYVPIAEAASGLDRWAIAARALPDGGHALAAMTLWLDVEAALAAYGGDLSRVRTLDAQSHGESLERVDSSEVDADGARRGPGSPALLRLTSGRVARGLDADIQQELRRHLSGLAPEALEAFVGRRVLGADVEIALVTTWSAVPDGVSLEDPIWPSISSRYDTFRVEVLDVLLEGGGAG